MTNSTESAVPAASTATRVALALLILVACLLAASTWRVYSNTWDEPEHLAAGIELLDKGRYEYDTEHPPIVRIFMALGPYLAGARSFGTPPPDGVQEGVDILYSGGHYTLYLTLARLGRCPSWRCCCMPCGCGRGGWRHRRVRLCWRCCCSRPCRRYSGTPRWRRSTWRLPAPSCWLSMRCSVG